MAAGVAVTARRAWGMVASVAARKLVRQVVRVVELSYLAVVSV
jgi:hypothetical protein